MYFKIERASDTPLIPETKPCEDAVALFDGEWSIEIASIEALVELAREVGHPLVIEVDYDVPLIRIYDDLIEE